MYYSILQENFHRYIVINKSRAGILSNITNFIIILHYFVHFLPILFLS